jgi:acyl-coenzyme A synthetase/AMP-(fatty) acid ligase
MNMPRSRCPSLLNALLEAERSGARQLRSAKACVSLRDLRDGSAFGGRLAELEGRSVLVMTGDQLTAALALIELDGIAHRLILCPPDISAPHLLHVRAITQADAVVSGHDDVSALACDVPLRVPCSPPVVRTAGNLTGDRETEWVLLTSGTTGLPKMVVHTLATLTAAIKPANEPQHPIVWATFYDIRRYGGLQILFRGLLCGGSLVLSDPHEHVGEHLERLATHGVTHVSGTPSHWRRALMSPNANAISPRYIRLSGEIADQATLDHLRATYPRAAIGHAYASTEAGVAFEVDDGREGFPGNLIGAHNAEVHMQVADGSLRIRSSRTALRYLGADAPPLLDADGFVDTGDLLQLRGGRYHFAGRRGGIINVGGLKVHPEEVEAVINRHPDVSMSLVRSRRNPITGAIVVADVVLRAQPEPPGAIPSTRTQDLRREILQACRAELSEHKVPASIRFVPVIDISPSGKLVRQDA